MGLTEKGRIVVGIPMVTSFTNMRFWMQLCDAASLPEAQATLQQLQNGGRDTDNLAGLFKEFNRELAEKVLPCGPNT